jgi:hypothetical protein
MAKQILSEEFRRMQELAGIIVEEQLNENIEFPEMDDEFEGAMETGDYDSPQDYLQDIIDTPSSQLDLSDYYEIENAVEQGDYSRSQAIKLMKLWAKDKINQLSN